MFTLQTDHRRLKNDKGTPAFLPLVLITLLVSQASFCEVKKGTTPRANLEITRKAEKTAEDLHELGVRLKKITVQYHV